MTFEVSPIAAPIECDEHGVIERHLCPWPNCKKGISENQFIVRYNDENISTYTRKQWNSPLGDHYYTWLNEDLSNYFWISRTYLNEIRRHGLNDKTVPNLLYHYTSLDGFMGITKNKGLWMTDHSYLNDTKELAHGVEVFNTIAEKLIAKAKDSKVVKLLTLWKEEVSTIQNRVFITSLSKDGDNLSQWRAYGSIAIGFETHLLPLSINEVQLNKIEYDITKQEQFLEIYLEHLCQAYSADISDDSNDIEKLTDTYEKVEDLLQVITFFKDKSFIDEKEYRLVYLDNESIKDFIPAEPPKKHFRVSGAHLIPYVLSNDIYESSTKCCDFPIKEIVLGPDTDDLLEKGVREYIKSLGLEGIEIRRSAIPFRA